MKKYLYTAALLVTGFWASAQSNINLYHFEPIAQSVMVNPAGKQDYRLVIGIPGVNNYGISLTNTPFSPNDLLTKGSDINDDLDKIIGGLKPEDRLFFSFETDLLFVGFQAGRSYWSFGLRHNSQVNFQYPSELLQFLYYGNNNSSMNLNYINVNELNVDALSYHTAHIGYQRSFMDEKLRIGIRGKLYSGIANLKVDKFNLAIDAPTNGDPWVLSSDIVVRTAGMVGFDSIPEVGVNSVGFTENIGYGFDLGVNYQITPKWEVGATALNIGSITWKANTSKQVSNGTYEWEGIEQNYPESNNGGKIENVVDSLVAVLEFQETKGESYTTRMPAQYIVSTRYQLSKRHAFGLVYQLNAWENGQTFSNYGVTYTGHILSWFKIMASYNSIGGVANNVGAGLVLKGGPMQLFLMTDNILALTDLGSSATTSFRFGLNIALNRRQPKLAPLEKPIVVPIQTPEVETPSNNESPNNN